MNKVYKILDDISKYENNTMSDNIKTRLNNNLKQYLKELNVSYISLITKVDSKKVVKELIKN